MSKSIHITADKLVVTEEHEILRAAARRLLAERCPMSEIRRLAEHAAGFDTRLYRQIASLGWPALLVAEEHDGIGLDHLSMALVLEECGRALLPGPLLPAVLAALALELGGSAAQKRQLLPGIADGSQIATVGLSEPGGSFEPHAVSATATAAGDGYVLSGIKVHVPFAEAAQHMIAPFLLAGGEIGLFAVDLAIAGVRIEAEIGIDPTRRAARVALDNVAVGASARLAHGDAAMWRALHVRGYALLAAEAVGAAEAILLRTRDYAIERVQFDRPIGTFQAVKHPLVDVLVAIEQARSLVMAAIAALDSIPDQAEIPARMAKAAATAALSFAADRGVQLHGGYGFTWDCDAHFFVKRALWTAATLGDPAHHRAHLGRYLMEHTQ